MAVGVQVESDESDAREFVKINTLCKTKWTKKFEILEIPLVERNHKLISSQRVLRKN